MARLNWTDQAVNDLISIANFIAKDSKRYAKVTILKIRNSAKQLNSFPLSGRVVPEINIIEIREIIVGNYRLIYFIVDSNRIDILAVHHSAKRLDSEELKKYVR